MAARIGLISHECALSHGECEGMSQTMHVMLENEKTAELKTA